MDDFFFAGGRGEIAEYDHKSLGEILKTVRWATMLNRIKQVLSSIQISKIVVHAIVTGFQGY